VQRVYTRAAQTEVQNLLAQAFDLAGLGGRVQQGVFDALAEAHSRLKADLENWRQWEKFPAP
jgi:hypothetical protein